MPALQEFNAKLIGKSADVDPAGTSISAALAAKFTTPPSDGKIYAVLNGVAMDIADRLLPPAFATGVSDISGWTCTGGTLSLDGDGRVTIDTPGSVTEIVVSGGGAQTINPNSVTNPYRLTIANETSITSIGTAPLTSVTVLLCNGCTGLVALPPMPAAGYIFANGCTNLASVLLPGVTSYYVSASSVGYFGLTGCALDAAALNALYDSLGTAAGPVIIDVTGNPGASGDDPTIATGKGWVVAGT